MIQNAPDPPADSLLMTCPQVARALCCSERSVHSWSASGKLPGKVQIGRAARWQRDAIELWIRAGCPAERN